MEIKELKKEAKAKSLAIAIGGSGKINGKEFPMIEYDGLTEDQVIAFAFELQDEFGLNQFALLKTKNGFHVRFYFDWMPHDRIELILEASKTNAEYLSIAKENYCINRVAGKHKEKDIKYLGLFGQLKNPDSNQVVMGKSLLKLHLKMQKITIQEGFLL